MALKIIPALAFLLVFTALAAPVWATEQFALKTGLSCAFCHENPSGGGTLTQAGEKYLAQISGKSKKPSFVTRYARFVIGYLHILAGIIWFGAIFYVHIILKPAYASKGLPKGELILGWTGIIVVGVTGIFLTAAVMPSFGALFQSRFGILLIVKIFLYLIMAI
ncbi:MAG: cytochrome B5, partial [Nitrospirota bacterium]